MTNQTVLLTDPDIERVTGFKRRTEQLAELRRLGIRHMLNRRFEIVVLWSAVEAVLGPQAGAAGPTDQPEGSAFQ